MNRLMSITAVIAIVTTATIFLCHCSKIHVSGESSAVRDSVSGSNSVVSSSDNTPTQDENKAVSIQNGFLKQDVAELTQFVNVEDLDSSVEINLKYATSDNFTGKPIYTSSVCVLRKETATKLLAAETEFANLGYHIKVWDAYRPLSVQKILFAAESNTNYIADPATGSRHNRGAAVDITLVDENGNEIEMPSGFDEFTIKAHRNNPDMSKEAQNNLATLTSVMTECGFTTINDEWWHFDDSDWNNYPIMDVHLEDFADVR